jgi:hypothetical protein
MRRRDALILGGAVAVALAIPPVLRRLPADFDFEPLPGIPGFRRLAGGQVSGIGNPFVGLGESRSAPARPVPEGPAAVCEALFGDAARDPGGLPVAIFSDFFCPFCREQEQRLVAREATGEPIRLVWHEMPLLGAGSMRAARTVLAAERLGAGRRGRDYLWTTPLRPGPAALARMADALGLDRDVFLREVEGPRVDKALEESLALGDWLGVYATPVTLIGRTMVVGAIRPADLAALIELERAEGPLACG